MPAKQKFEWSEFSWIEASWDAPDSIRAGCTTRIGGYSLGPYRAFNLANHVADDPQTVVQNRQHLSQGLVLPSEPVWLNQIHSNQVYCHDNVDNGQQLNPDADAIYSQQPKSVCTVMTADCLPVLFCDEQGESIAAAHAGWRGLANGILRNTLSKFSQPNSQILAWMGPAIGASAFEVGRDVYDAFCQTDSRYEKSFAEQSEGKTEKWLMDIYQAARVQLQSLGLTKIYGGEYCSYTQADRFYSYRREQTTGRMASVIWRVN